MSRKLLLGLNIDHVATLRQARYRQAPRQAGQMIEPDPVFAAQLAERAGASGITVHLREDRRHIQDRDVWRLRESIQTRLNLEMACTDAMLELALELKPDSICLVPESREEITTEGGLDAAGHLERVRKTTETAQDAGIDVSLFIDPEPQHIDTAKEVGAPLIELHTGAFANAYYHVGRRNEELAKLRTAAERAHGHGITVNAGHGINFVNIEALMEAVPHLHELNIGHSIISRAVLSGLEEAVREMSSRLMRYRL